MKKSRKILLGILDILAINFAIIIVLGFKFDWKIPEYYFNVYLNNAIAINLIKILIFNFVGFYNILWEHATAEDYFKIIFGSLIANIIIFIYFQFLNISFPRSVLPIAFLAEVGFFIFYRVVPKITFKRKLSLNKKEKEKDLYRTLIVGAGEAGSLVLKEIKSHDELIYDPIGFLDDSEAKQGMKIQGVEVLGQIQDANRIINEKNIDTIILAIPSLNFEDRNRILNTLSNENIRIKIVPGFYQIVDGGTNRLMIRDVEIEDLLGRETVELDTNIIKEFIENRTILITGAGGSIGSELSRQIAKYSPKKLILLDIYENGVYDVQMELNRTHPELDKEVLIESVRDKERIDFVFRKYRPEIVFHAAAHKHVPLMEFSPQSAIKNNVFGTYNVAKFASEYGVMKFVLISTDKAVNPTNIMGATKTMCERTIRYWDERSKTSYSAVRFGNVLGSNGSVIPLFKKQIESGGPVTVTSDEINRFFMTIPEACQLVLTSGAMAKGGEIFILDMGKPVKIIDLAEKLISLSGYTPYEDIDIKVIGLRPGEKLYEEILLDKETAIKTPNKKIYIDEPKSFDSNKYEMDLEKLRMAAKKEDVKEIREIMEEVIETYHPYIPE